MERLLKYCLQELSFEGDFGCSIVNWPNVVSSFYETPDSRGTQTVDDDYVSYVWSLFMRFSGVRVGIRPQGAPDIWIAPKAPSKAKDIAPKPELQPVGDKLFTPTFRGLVDEFGESLRVAADRDIIFETLTGSHVQPAKLTDMAYTVLQLISRTRGAGMPVDDMTKTTGYSSGTLFYLVKTLQDLGLILKVRAGGLATNITIHRHFWERSPTWQRVYVEERASMEEARGGGNILSVDQEEPEDAEIDVKGAKMEANKLQFDPIDGRFLSSSQLVRSRVIKLLKNSQNQTHFYTNLIFAIGCRNPSRTDRRFFTVRIRDGIRDGLWEKVAVPGGCAPDGKRRRDVCCLRLLSDTPNQTERSRAEADEDENKANSVKHDVDSLPLWNVTIHRQVNDLLEEAGDLSFTINDISEQLGQFDKRTLEHLLDSFAASLPAPHLLDCGVVSILQHFGRERRHEYWTIPAFRRTLSSSGETADLPQHLKDIAQLDLSDVGQFSFHGAEEFYGGNEERLVTVVDNYDTFTHGSTIGKRAREQKKEKTGGVVKPRGRPRKHPRRTQESPPAKKKSRPHKQPDAEGGPETQPPTKRGRSRKSNATDGKPTKGRGRLSNKTSAHETCDKTPPKGSPGGALSRQGHSGIPNEKALPPAPDLNGPNPGDNRAGGAAIRLTPDISLPLNAPRASTRLPASSQTKPGRVRKSMDAYTQDPPPKRRKIDSKTQSTQSVPTELIDSSAASTIITEAPPVTSREDLTPNSSALSAVITPQHPTVPDNSLGIKTTSQKADLQSASSPSAAVGSSGKGRKATSITAMRRREEFMRVLEMMGGIANSVSSDFLDQHTALLSTIATKASAPAGTSMDRRTMKETFESMVALNMVTSTSFSVSRVNGSQRPVTIWTLPDVDQVAVERHMDTVKGVLGYRPAAAVKKLTTPIAYDWSTKQKTRIAPMQRMTEEGLQIADLEDPEERRAWIMLEPRVVLQSAGYISGCFARVKELHLFLLAQMERENLQSSHFLSNRIFRTEYLWEDMPFGAYCSQIPATELDENLNKYLASEAHRWTPTKSVPKEFGDRSAVGKTRCRQQFRRSLGLLEKFGIVTPLTHSDSATPFLICGSFRFEILAEPILAEYWIFNDVVPLYKFHKIPQEPPFVVNADISTEEGRLKFWHQLQHMSLHPTPDIPVSDSGPPYTGGGELVRAVIKTSSWDGDYVLSPLQKEHLVSLINQATGENKFGDEDYMRAQEYITGAPHDAIRRFIDRKVHSILAAAERIRKRERLEILERERRGNAKRVLAEKAAEVRQRLQREWVQFLKSVCPENTPDDDVSRLAAIREDFFKSGGRLGGNFKPNKLAARISDVLGVGKHQRLGPLPAELSQRFRNPRHQNLIPQITFRSQLIPSGKSVYDLINAQEPRPERTSRAQKGSRLGVGRGINRKRRFKWSADYDELALDAMAIIRARARNAGRTVDLEPLRQIFPGIDRNGVRNRVRRIIRPIEGYVRRLETTWAKFWLEFRGTDGLSDEHPHNLRDFDLAEHIIFLRQRIDKKSLRAGLETETSVILSHTVHSLLDHFDVVESHPPDGFGYDFLQTLPSDELREKEFMEEAFTWPPATVDATPNVDEEFIGRAMALIKMTISTDEAKFDQDDSERLLRDIESTTLRKAHDALRGSYIALAEGKRRPGKAFRYQDSQNALINGTFPDTMYRDADELEGDLYAAKSWLDWPLTGSDGSVAALVALVSDMKLLVNIGVPNIGEVREQISDNSKKISKIRHNIYRSCVFIYYWREADEHVECMTSFRFPDVALCDSSSASQSPLSVSGAPALPLVDSSPLTSPLHHTKMSGLQTRCILDVDYTAGDVIECQGCLDEISAALPNSAALPDRATLTSLLDIIRGSEAQGVTIFALLEHGFRLQDIHRAINSLSTCSPPLLYCISYGSIPRIVSATHIRSWTAIIKPKPEDAGIAPERLVLPRRWRDIHGDMMHEIWHAALKAVLSTVMSHPAIPESELVKRLRNIFDRPEIMEALAYLCAEGFLRPSINEEFETTDCSADVVIGSSGGSESSNIYWLPNNTHPWWYIYHHGGNSST